VLPFDNPYRFLVQSNAITPLFTSWTWKRHAVTVIITESANRELDWVIGLSL